MYQIPGKPALVSIASRANLYGRLLAQQTDEQLPMSTTNSTVFSAEDVLHRKSGERTWPQIAWLYQAGEPRTLVSRLARRFDECGLATGITAFERTGGADLPEFDLLLLEYTCTNWRDLARTVREIRNQSAAPVIVLVRAEVADLTVAALGAGADLVLPLNTSEEVIAARCRALLRRWCPSISSGVPTGRDAGRHLVS